MGFFGGEEGFLGDLDVAEFVAADEDGDGEPHEGPQDGGEHEEAGFEPVIIALAGLKDQGGKQRGDEQDEGWCDVDPSQAGDASGVLRGRNRRWRG